MTTVRRLTQYVPLTREEFRRHSVVSGVCRATITGLGAGGYHLALEAMPWIT